MRFNQLLADAGIDAKKVAVLLHFPKGRFPAHLAFERPEVFDTWQRFHAKAVQPTLTSREIWASFISFAPGDYVFVGLFRRVNCETWPLEVIEADSAFRESVEMYGVESLAAICHANGWTDYELFSTELMDELAKFRGRLHIAKPKGRKYVRLAEKLDAVVTELTREPQYAPKVPEWQEYVVTGPEVRNLPRDWAARLAEWRGVYLIVDEKDGARYVGSAYGQDNLLSRWRNHVGKETGVTAALRARDPARFRFSILQRVNPDALVDEVTALEQNWMRRLHTKEFGLNA